MGPEVSNIFDDTSRSQPKSSVLRSILSSKGHKRSPSAGDALIQKIKENSTFSVAPILPADHPHFQSHHCILGERPHNRDAAVSSHFPQIAASRTDKEELHKYSKSSLSLKALVKDKDRKGQKHTGSHQEESQGSKIKKIKSSTSLSAILKRSQRGHKNEIPNETRDKENQSPTESLPSPVWAQYATQLQPVDSIGPYIPDSCRTLDEEVSLYTPKCYSPSKQRNFYDYQPTLAKRSDPKPRPKSDNISSNPWRVREILGYGQRIPSAKDPNFDQSQDKSTAVTERIQNDTSPEPRSDPNVGRGSGPPRGSRVMACVSIFNGKASNVQKGLNSNQIESEFEKLLDARNVPQNMRDKMRSLDTNIKADFIQKDRAESSLSSVSSKGTSFGSSGRQRRSKDIARTPTEEKPTPDVRGPQPQTRSRTFTWTKGEASPSKKAQKSENGSSHKRPISVDFSRPGSSKQLTPSSSMASLVTTPHLDMSADPTDFIHYLKEVQKPEIVEVGKLHKLRLLLRNETVSWVDTFISDGGMNELVQLLYRITKVEWREEHEDTLLHETLLCLKALCTTSLALKALTTIEEELFPALLRMLFDEEKKGPSEFTTRGIIISLLFTYLSATSIDEISSRALKILSYLRDPSPSDNQPLEFIANIYQARPYRVWCKEVTNVTKEVFWIFLHHLNVIPAVQPSTSSGRFEEAIPYSKRHFPSPRPPVPAAPYVGGVEWDATNYLAAHLDLMNGLIASLPTCDARNALRTELRASGFEKVMGKSLRTCKEKFYSAVHDCLKTWIAAAMEDGWPYTYIREGPPRMSEPGSPAKSIGKTACVSPKKGNLDDPPKLALDIDLENGEKSLERDDNLGKWL